MGKEMNKLSTNVIEAIEGERDYQMYRWGPAALIRSQDEWLLYILDYAQEAAHQGTRGQNEEALHTVRKIATLATNCMEQHGVKTRK